MSPFYSMIGQNRGITANANEGMYDRAARANAQMMAQWHDSIEREKERKFREKEAEKARSEARKQFWTGKAVDVGTGIAGGAVIGGMAAGMGEAGATAATEFGPQNLTAGYGEGLGVAASPTMSAAAAPAFKPFAGGSVAKGALLGGALGGIGGLGGQNYLSPALAMPGADYAREMGAWNTANDNAMGWANLGMNQARLASNEAWKQKTHDEDVAHNLEIETDRARRTDAYSRYMENSKPKPKSTLSMTVGPDGGRTLKGHPDEVGEWEKRNPMSMTTNPIGGGNSAADPIADTVSRIEYMLETNPNATDDDVIGFTKGLSEEQRRRVLQILLTPAQR